MEDITLSCIACGGEARLHGRCSHARVACTACGLDLPAQAYAEDIEHWKDTACNAVVETENAGDAPASEVAL